ncbi:MAG TPA: SSI family serine proteinase inhibitor [Actinomycetota bacterium]|jgi:hypothetical protein|nr:SSI family serine proteinase inhibitor [Actinomycetota bacterium]
MDATALRTFSDLAPPQSHRLITFDKAEVATLESDPPQYLLTVSGTKPWLNMSVELTPLIYVQRPEYWGIEVVGMLRGISPAVLAPYEVSLNITHLLGTKGIEVIGSDRSEKIDVPGSYAGTGRFELRILNPDGDVLSSSTLTCGPAGGSHPHAEKACAQLAEADGEVGKVPAEDRICTKEFKPVVLVAEGTWKGEARSFKQEFGNLCTGIGATGGVIFDFEG